MSLGNLGSGLGGLSEPDGKKKGKPGPAKTAEAEGAQELSAALVAFKQASKREDDRFAMATSPDYWFGIYFETQEQRDEFLAFLKAQDLLEVQWVNGRKLTERLGCRLKSPRLPRRSFKIDPKLTDLSL
jgi:hypothetical protein